MMNDQIERFFAANVGRWAPSTERNYARPLLALGNWLETIGESDFSKATTELLLDFLNDQDWGPSGRHQAISALRVYFRWAVGEQSPAAGIHFPKRPESSRSSLLPREAMEMLAVPDTSTVKGKRNFSILALLLDTGLRNSELRNALISNLLLQDRTLQVLIKGARWEWCVFSEQTMRALEEWLYVRWAVPDEQRIFVSLGGSQIGTGLGETGLEYIIRCIARQAGIGHACPHQMRHTFAEISLRAGASTRLLQAAGRWKDIKTVETYTRRLDLEQFRPYFPMSYLMDVPGKERDS